MKRRKVNGAPKAVITLYVEVGTINVIERASERWNVSRNESANRILKRGIGALIAENAAAEATESLKRGTQGHLPGEPVGKTPEAAL